MFYVNYNFVASQMWLFGHILPLLNGQYIPEEEEQWMLYLQLMDNINISLPNTSEDYAVYLSTLVTDHHNEFYRLERLTQAYAKRLNRIWSSSLSSKHKVHTTNTWDVAVFRYFFAQVKWPDKTLVQLDRLTRKILRRFNSHHYSASIEQLYLRRISGGRGVVNIRQAYEREVVASGLYLVESVQDELCRRW